MRQDFKGKTCQSSDEIEVPGCSKYWHRHLFIVSELGAHDRHSDKKKRPKNKKIDRKDKRQNRKKVTRRKERLLQRGLDLRLQEMRSLDQNPFKHEERFFTIRNISLLLQGLITMEVFLHSHPLVDMREKKNKLPFDISFFCL